MTASGSSPGNALAIVLTGVSGSGKSEVGREVAKRLGVKFLDADDFHSAANKDKMHRGIALTDDDRRTWLENLHDALRQELDSGTSCVLACSALKRVYREQLRDGLDGVRFFYLKIDYEVVARRPGVTNGSLFRQEVAGQPIRHSGGTATARSLCHRSEPAANRGCTGGAAPRHYSRPLNQPKP
jgi:gluconokinase